MKKKYLLLIFGISLNILFLYLAFSRVNWNLFLKSFLSFPIGYFALALTLSLCHSALMAFKWKLFLSPYDRISYWTAFWSMRLSYFLNSILPARMGEPMRVWFIRQRHSIPMGKLIGLTVADRVLDALFLVGLVLVSIFYLGIKNDLFEFSGVSLLLLTIIMAIFGLRYLPKESNSRLLGWFFNLVHHIRDGLRVLGNWKVFLPAAFVSVICWGLHIAMISILVSALGVPIKWAEAMIVAAAVSLAVSIPTTPGHLGTFEFAVVFSLTKLTSISPELAATVAILYHFTQILPNLVVGSIGVSYFRGRLFQKMKEIQSAA